MIISSNNERNEDDVVESNLSDVSISTPEISVTSSDDSFITDSIIPVNEEINNPTTNSSIQTDDISPIENIKVEEVPIESSISISADDDEVVQNVTENVPAVVEQEFKLTVDEVEEVKSTMDDEIIPIVKIDVNSSNTTDSKVLDTCDFNLAIPNRNIPSITYSTNCDFSRHDMYVRTCITNAFACASLCAGDRRCTHFTYISNLNSGTCRLKYAPGSGGSWASAVKAPSPYVCGYIGKRAFNNILLGLCLSLDINVNI
jgi:hypothetical protein